MTDADRHVVKAADADPQPLYPAARLVRGATLEAEDALEQARSVLAQAEADARRIRAAAETARDAELDAARLRGHQEGLAQFAELLAALRDQSTRIEAEFRQEVTKSAFKIARWVLDTEFRTQPEQVTALVEAAIEDVRTRFPSRLCVHLHPEDHAIVADKRADLERLLPGDVQFDLVQNVEITLRSVIVETEMGHYDFGIASQLRAIEEALGDSGASS